MFLGHLLYLCFVTLLLCDMFSSHLPLDHPVFTCARWCVHCIVSYHGRIRDKAREGRIWAICNLTISCALLRSSTSILYTQNYLLIFFRPVSLLFLFISLYVNGYDRIIFGYVFVYKYENVQRRQGKKMFVCIVDKWKKVLRLVLNI